jgi:hypothetical protein
VNGKSSREDVSESINLVTALQKSERFYTWKGTVVSGQRSQTILIVVDSTPEVWLTGLVVPWGMLLM